VVADDAVVEHASLQRRTLLGDQTMSKRASLLLAAGVSLACASLAPAGTKPCRDKAGKVIQCSKVRTASPRCKDASGKFIACSPSSTPALGTTSGTS
jgi:hypothetical protein